MSMSTSIVGVRDLDGRFAVMAALKEACDKAKVKYPPEVIAYFKHPHEGVEQLKKDMEAVNITAAVSRPDHDGCDIWVVDLAKLDTEVKAIRFCNSY